MRALAAEIVVPDVVQQTENTGVTIPTSSERDRESSQTSPIETDRPSGPGSELHSATRDNIERLAELQEREESKISRVQAAIEAGSRFFGSPAYFIFVLLFIVAWVLVNTWGEQHGWRHVDEPPYFWLQGLVSSNALLLTIAVLIRQNRMSRLAAERAHLDLQINLLTEQKVSKVLEVVDELRKSLGVKVADQEAEELATAADPEAILTALKETDRDPSPTLRRRIP